MLHNLIGIVLNIIGFVLMMGGAAEDPNTFDGDELFSHVRITLAPIIIVIAYIIIIYGMKLRTIIVCIPKLVQSN